MTSSGQLAVMDGPSEAGEGQLKELGIQSVTPKPDLGGK